MEQKDTYTPEESAKIANHYATLQFLAARKGSLYVSEPVRNTLRMIIAGRENAIPENIRMTLSPKPSDFVEAIERKMILIE